MDFMASLLGIRSTCHGIIFEEFSCWCNWSIANHWRLNEILNSSKREGGAQRPSAMMQVFRNYLADCGLDDADFIGDPLTWARGMIREWLDKAFCNGAWSDKFPIATLIHEQQVQSNHKPFLDTEYIDASHPCNLMEAPL